MKRADKIIFSICFFVTFYFCSSFFAHQNRYVLGCQHAQKSWIYLSGLTEHLNTDQEVQNRQILDEIGQELNIKIIAVPSQFRQELYGNKLCWPHENKQLLAETYAYILSTIDTPIAGYIGFSNGGFFLHYLLQKYPIHVPIITIGASGYFQQHITWPMHSITLILGKEDASHYDQGIGFFKQLQDAKLPAKLIEHDGGHCMPKNLLKKHLQELVLGNELS